MSKYITKNVFDFVITQLYLKIKSAFMDTSTYTSSTNEGNVKKADESIHADSADKLSGVEEAQPLQYYGKDTSGTIGYHYFPVGSSSGIVKYEIENANANQSYTFSTTIDFEETGAISQEYKYIEGTLDVISIVDDNTNTNHYSDNIIFDSTGAKINSVFSIDLELENDYYKSPIITKSDFMNNFSIEIGGN